jgi:serpin B
VLSPTSAAFALSIPLLGAGGATANEIATTLGVQGFDRTTLRRRTAAAMTAGTGRSDVQLEIANAMWVDTRMKLNPNFVDAVAPYRALIRSESLAAKSTVPEINAWADSVTHGKITKVLNEPLPDAARLFIANAVYFKGKWRRVRQAATRRRDFRLASGEIVQVEGMERSGHVGYRRGERYQMIRLPYRGGRFAMYVALPDSGTPAATIEQDFAAHGMPASLIAKDFREVHFVIPRLHAELSYDLLPALASLGIHRAFDCDAAEFHGIGTGRDGAGSSLCIAKVSQAVYLDVDEEGTEAAAVTEIAMTVTALAPPPLQLIVDRPFLFLLRDEQTGADLFVGTIRRP